jgi:hypothetical protein
MTWLQAFAGVVRAPRETLGALARSGSWRPGALAVLSTGTLWAAFLLVLHRGGHAPSGPLVLPIPRVDYYLYEAAFVTPALLAMWLGASVAGHAIAKRLGGRATLADTASPIAYALATPFLVAWLLPDAVVMALAGFEAMAKGMRVYVPISALWTLVLLFFAIRASHGVGRGAALLAAIAAFITQSAIGAPSIR